MRRYSHRILHTGMKHPRHEITPPQILRYRDWSYDLCSWFWSSGQLQLINYVFRDRKPISGYRSHALRCRWLSRPPERILRSIRRLEYLCYLFPQYPVLRWELVDRLSTRHDMTVDEKWGSLGWFCLLQRHRPKLFLEIRYDIWSSISCPGHHLTRSFKFWNKRYVVARVPCPHSLHQLDKKKCVPNFCDRG